MPHPPPHGPMVGGMPPMGDPPQEGMGQWVKRKMMGCDTQDRGCRERTVMDVDGAIHRGMAEGRYQNIDFNQWDKYREKYMSGAISTYQKEEILSRIQYPTEVAGFHKPQDGPIIPQIPHKPTEAPPPLPHLLEPQMKPPADGLFHEIPPEDPNMLQDIMANLANIPKILFAPKKLASGAPPHCYDLVAQREYPLPDECMEPTNMKPIPSPMMAQVGEEEINEEDLLRQEREEKVSIVDKTHENAVVSQAGENEWAEARDDYLGGKAMNYKTEIAAIVTKYKVKPVDCKTTDWSSWSDKENECGTRNRNILVKPQHGGTDCSDLQEITECSPIDCVVEWSGWTECVNGIQHKNATITEKARYGGKDCGDLQQTKDCVMPVVEEPVVEPTVAMEVIVEPVAIVEDRPAIISAIVDPLVQFVQLFTPGKEAIVVPVISDTSTVQQEVIPVQTGLPAEPASSAVSITAPSPVAEVKPATIDTPEDEAKDDEVAAKVEPTIEEKKARWPWVVGGLAIVGGGFFFISKRK